ncbi:hypothetical protein V5O48_015647 [Marasmius crinis-equi]|uniref:Uncharacterized protein n=1 Tax=Marasmius crinis-equi TaxID=585013 RepID=A0ABR3ETZ8_9AGAR
MEFICPSKSPQAWVALKAARAIPCGLHAITHHTLELLYTKGILSYYSYTHYRAILGDVKRALNDTLNDLTGWSAVDMEVIHRSSVELVPPFYELRAFRWLVRELQDSPAMLPHLQNTLQTIPLHLVMPAVFDQWLFHPRRNWTTADIGAALQPNLSSDGIQSHKTLAQESWLNVHSKGDLKIFRQFLHYNHILINWEGLAKGDWDRLAELWKEIWNELNLSSLGARVGPPFSFRTLDRIMNDPAHGGFGLKLLKSCTETSSQWFGTNYCPLLNNLAQHIIATTTPRHRTYGSPAVTTSPFVGTHTCLDLIQRMHDDFLDDRPLVDSQAYNWLEATDIIQHIYRLDDEYFPPLPGYFPVPLTKLEGLLYGLPDEPSYNDFEFLFTYQRHWSKIGLLEEKGRLIQVLFKYINGFPTGTDTPLVTHPKGLEFLAFLYSQWEALRTELKDRYGAARAEKWYAEPGISALERARVANRLSPDEFEAMFTPIPDSRSVSTLPDAILEPYQEDVTNSAVSQTGEETEEGTDGGCSDGAGARIREEVNELVASSVRTVAEFGADAVGDTLRENIPVGGLGADNNV